MLDTQETSEVLKKWELLARAHSMGLTGPPLALSQSRGQQKWLGLPAKAQADPGVMLCPVVN